MDSKCLRLVRVCELLFVQLCKGVYHTVQARAVVLLLPCGLTRAFSLIIDSGARAFLCLFINVGKLFKKLAS